METTCRVCRSLTGEERISPGPLILAGEHWVVDHAYPVALAGWLVIVPRRHVEAFHELTPAEAEELGGLHLRVARLLHTVLGCTKEYAATFAEAPGFAHLHVHVVPRAAEMPAILRGPRCFALLAPGEYPMLPPAEVAALSERLRVAAQV